MHENKSKIILVSPEMVKDWNMWAKQTIAENISEAHFKKVKVTFSAHGKTTQSRAFLCPHDNGHKESEDKNHGKHF